MATVTTPRSLLLRLREEPDNASWDRLVAIYRPFIHKWLSLGSIRGHDLDDLLQDVLMTVVREISKFEHSGNAGAFRSWLKTVIHYRILGYRRTKAKRKDCEQDFDELISQLNDPRSDLSQHWDKEHDRFIVHRLLQLLRPEFSETIWLAFQRSAINNVQARQVADELGMSVNAVLIAKSRVLRRLREESAGFVD